MGQIRLQGIRKSFGAVHALAGVDLDVHRLPDRLTLPAATTAAALLRPGGRLVMEHADSQGESLPRALAATGDWADATDHTDLAGRPRTTTARRA